MADPFDNLVCPEFTAENAIDISLFIQDANGILRDVSGSANQVNPQGTLNTQDYQVFQNHWKLRLAGARDLTLQVQVVYSLDAQSGFQLLKEWFADPVKSREARGVRWMVPTEQVGADDQYGYFFLSQFAYTATADNAGPILATITLQQNGCGVNFATAAT